MTGMEQVRREAASLVMVGFQGLSLAEAAPLADLIGAGISGAILFKRNVESAAQVARLCEALRREAGRPFILSVDQEGGRVARLRHAPMTLLPPMREVGRTGSEPLAFELGSLLGREVRASGFDLDFAPVLDVDSNPANPVIGDRSFGAEPALVGAMGIALARGLESEGVASCGKHFPGHGDTAQDSHKELPRLGHALERLRGVELPPFAAYARAGLASIMTAHVCFDALDADPGKGPALPATFSRRALEGLLRNELGFAGLIISDDLEMNAISERYSMGEAAVLAVAAGVDLLLVCHRPERQLEVIEALGAEAERSEAFAARVTEAARRIAALKARFCIPARGDAEAVARLGLLESQEHQRHAALLLEAIAKGGASSAHLSQGVMADPTEA